MIFTAGRSVVRLRATCLRSRRTLVSSTTESAPVLQKLLATNNDLSDLAKSNLITSIARRFYADQPVSRPKAHTGGASTTGRTPKKSASTSATKKAAPKSSRPRRAATKAGANSKSKGRGKPKKKTKAKAKAKAKPKKKLTEVQKAAKSKRAQREKIKLLREKALLDSPDNSPLSAYKVFITEQFKGRNKDTTKPTQLISEAAGKWKNVSPEQLEHFNHIANQRTEAKKVTFVKWIESHTPEQIRDANIARSSLSRLQKKEGSKKAAIAHIKDERLVVRPKTGYLFFSMSRHRSGDFKGLKVSEASRLAGQEWKALSAADKKPFEDAAVQDKQRYELEKKTIYKS